jgi:flagellar hook-length control protein FliK
MHLVPLRLDADGIHRLTVHLHPADLGMVSLVAEIRDGAVHLHLAGANEAAREALREALPDLRRELQQGGFTRCSLDLGQGTPQGGHHPYERSSAPPAMARSEAPQESTVDHPVPTVTSARRLDLRI